MTVNKILVSIVAVIAIATCVQVSAQIIFYENEGYTGRTFITEKKVGDLKNHGFNNRASSVVVLRDRWEVCENARYSGRCVVLRPGRYPSLFSMGLNDMVTSVHMINKDSRIRNDRYAPPAEPIYDNFRRNNERLYQANVTSVHAVVGPPERRCWIQREQAIQERSDTKIPGALVGALLGGILGHQVGSGRGQDIATAGGVVAGAVIGSEVGRNSSMKPPEQKVEKCVSGPSRAVPIYWDVIYSFRGIDHRIQTTSPPGETLTVNRRGEPRT